MTSRLSDERVAIVTGAGRGMGREHALALSRAGCRVVVNDRDADVARRVADEIADHGGVAVHDSHDILEGSDAVVAHAIEEYGRLDVLVNNAGALGTTMFAETDAENWHRSCDMHIRSAVGMARAAWSSLLASPAGRIINVSSVGVLGNPGLTAYGTGKAAILGFTNSLAAESAGSGITVNCILPTAWTRMTEEMPDPFLREVLERHFGSDHVAKFVVRLAEPNCPFNGESFEVGGGWASRFQWTLGPAVDVGGDASSTSWTELADALLAEGDLTAVRTTSEWVGMEVTRVAPDLGRRAHETATEFRTVEYK